MSKWTGFNEYQKQYLAEAGFTLEEARDFALAKLRAFNAPEMYLEHLELPVDEISLRNASVITAIALRRNGDPEAWCEFIGRDLSAPSDYLHMLWTLDA